MSYDTHNPNSKPGSKSGDENHDQTATEIRKKLDEKIVDPQDLVYNQGTPNNPREVIQNPAVVPETFTDSQTPRSDLRHDDE